MQIHQYFFRDLIKSSNEFTEGDNKEEINKIVATLNQLSSEFFNESISELLKKRYSLKNEIFSSKVIDGKSPGGFANPDIYSTWVNSAP